MAIDPIQGSIIQSSLSAVQQKNKADEEREVRDKTKPELKRANPDEAEVPLVEGKDAPVGVENSDVEVEKVTLSRGKHKDKAGATSELVQESYLGKNIDLKG